MVERHPRLDRVFRALGDSTRRAILHRLADGELTVTELAAPFSISLAAVSKHLQALERAGLVRRRVEGRTHRCRLNPKPLAEADDWLRAYEARWTRRLEALAKHLHEHP
jgi:DNA-binding transcriptional ArsR family regulator